MLAPLARFLIMSLAAACLVALSVVSASGMAPDRETIQQQNLARALGVGFEDFCGGGQSNGTDCPFCHKLPEPPAPSAPLVERQLAYRIPPNFRDDLIIGPRQLQFDAPPRAPPVTV
ncbi:hypothetical protein EU805_08975 [Salipiger sp. IMCC34102]|uniref:hypothetical protein n=1 Tax=Salipiger sp. IMCC34102 TaxID=2510647 RepID=UPI00101D6AE4|nr:hypothetical protein [Salipiger sp. IMCC34102]RYH02732.1 hypothetical protein EU805_08975 [Salipiger sp. IMCC34102]